MLRITGEAAERFLEYDETELSAERRKSIESAHQEYLDACKSDPLDSA